MCVKLLGILHTQPLTLCVDNSPRNGQLYSLWLLHWLTSYALVNEDNNEMASFVCLGCVCLVLILQVLLECFAVINS